MTAFICPRCRDLCNTEDGYEEVGRWEIYCVPCFDRISDDTEEPAAA